MKYKELLEKLQSLDENQLNQTVTVYVSSDDEYFGISDSDFSKEETCDVLDPDHVYLRY
jgi:hypothetical protein